MLSPSTFIKKADHQVSCELDGEVVILDLKTSVYFGLNRVGAAIWEALNEPKTAADICTVIYEKYDVDESQCQEDVIDLLSNLENVGLIDIVDN